MNRQGDVPVISGDRWPVIEHLIPAAADSVLDIGCRDRALSTLLGAGVRYVGLDLFPPADVIASAEEPLPFGDGEFSCAVMADVLEHLDDPHGALDEAMRVSRDAVVVLLPNVYTLWYRLRILSGRPPGDKYHFGAENPLDRHRWMLSYDEAAAFTRGRAAARRWRVVEEYAHDRRFNRLLARAAYAAARVAGGPNLWAWEYVARLEPAS